jgi:uncharacterized surface protein with fasciclin (FAS1) repeats
MNQNILFGAISADQLDLVTPTQCTKSICSQSGKSIIDILKKEERFSKLVSILKEQQGLTDDLSSGKNITFFAPTNQALDMLEQEMASLSKNRESMEKVLRYHFCERKLMFKDLCDGMTLETRLKVKQLGDQRQRIRVFKCMGIVALNMFTRIQEVDCEASNGVIQVIDRVLLPPLNIQETLDFIPTQFSTWLLACHQVGVAKELREKSHLTCFVPTNHAWQNLGYRALSYLFSKEGEKDLRRIVEYHLCPELVYADRMVEKKKMEFETMCKGEKIEFNLEEMKRGEKSMKSWGWSGRTDDHREGISPNCYRMVLNRGESRVVFTDGCCENGNIFIISNVLIPTNACLGEERRGGMGINMGTGMPRRDDEQVRR